MWIFAISQFEGSGRPQIDAYMVTIISKPAAVLLGSLGLLTLLWRRR